MYRAGLAANVKVSSVSYEHDKVSVNVCAFENSTYLNDGTSHIIKTKFRVPLVKCCLVNGLVKLTLLQDF